MSKAANEVFQPSANPRYGWVSAAKVGTALAGKAEQQCDVHL